MTELELRQIIDGVVSALRPLLPQQEGQPDDAPPDMTDLEARAAVDCKRVKRAIRQGRAAA